VYELSYRVGAANSNAGKGFTAKDTKYHEGTPKREFLREPSCPSWLAILRLLFQKVRVGFDFFDLRRMPGAVRRDLLRKDFS